MSNDNKAVKTRQGAELLVYLLDQMIDQATLPVGDMLHTKDRILELFAPKAEQEQPFGWVLEFKNNFLFYFNQHPNPTFSDPFYDKHNENLVPVYREPRPDPTVLVEALEAILRLSNRAVAGGEHHYVATKALAAYKKSLD
jgi:hypothetical protein